MIETKFKNSEVGTIPEDWEAKALGEVFEFKNGLNASKDCFGHGTPIVNYRDVYDNYSLKREQIKGLVSLSQADIKRYQVKKGDVFFTRTSETPEEVGLTSVLLDDIENCVFSGFVLRARPYKNINIDYRYFAFCFLTKSVRNEIIQGCSCTTRALTNGRLLSGVHVILPPTSTEQSRIATALSDVDDLIATLKKLIEKKRNIKQGVMQELLSGKRRLPGFSDKWVETKVGSLTGKISRGHTLTSDEFQFGNVPVMAGGKQYAGFHNVANQKGRTITISGSGASAGYIYLHNSPIFATDCSVIAESNTFSLDFLYYLLSFKQEELYKLQTGGAQPHVYPRDIEAIDVFIPENKDEQARISKILFDMDSEITMLESRLTKYQSLKQGMMQQLLTGKIRLI